MERMPKHSVGAEIGVWLGDFSALALRVVKPQALHLIDPWKYEPDPAYQKSQYGGEKGCGQARMDLIFSLALKRFKRDIASGVVCVHRSPSTAAVATFPDDYFDWVYIDGNHQYEFVRKDLEAFYPKVKSDGLIAGDDYGHDGWWQGGVTRAVDEFVARGLGEVVLIEDSQFVLRKKGQAR